MTFYTSGLKTHLMDAIHHSDFQTEFRFKPDTVYLTNARLANVGATAGTSANNYNPLVGNAAIIQSIHLYDGNQMLDQLLEFPQWAGFSSFNNRNQKNVDSQKVLSCTGLGYNYSNLDVPADDGATFGATHAKIEQHFIPKEANTTAATTAKGWLSLKSILPFLDNSLYLPTSIYKNLRLVIQYNSKPNVILGNAATPLEPFLIVDEIVDDQKQNQITKSYKGVQFQAIEHDRVYLDAATAGNVQTNTFTIGGFDNKRVGRLIVVNSATDATLIGQDKATIGCGSQSVYKQKIQLRINGQNRFWSSGIGRPMERLAKLTDTWGTMNAFPGSSDVDILNKTNVVANDILQYVSRFDYFGCSVGDEVLELQLDYSRTGTPFTSGVPATSGNQASNQALQLNVFAEVLKSISVGGGGKYTIAYA